MQLFKLEELNFFTNSPNLCSSNFVIIRCDLLHMNMYIVKIHERLVDDPSVKVELYGIL